MKDIEAHKHRSARGDTSSPPNYRGQGRAGGGSCVRGHFRFKQHQPPSILNNLQAHSRGLDRRLVPA